VIVADVVATVVSVRTSVWRFTDGMS